MLSQRFGIVHLVNIIVLFALTLTFQNAWESNIIVQTIWAITTAVSVGILGCFFFKLPRHSPLTLVKSDKPADEGEFGLSDHNRSI